LLQNGSAVAPYETDLWDYKAQVANEPVSLAKLVRWIVSFHNSFGGFIVLGVNETVKDSEFEVVGIGEQRSDRAQITDLIVKYTGRPIEITITRCSVETPGGRRFIESIWCPKRPNGVAPVEFCRDGPGDAKDRPFQRETVYFRAQDRCVRASKTEQF